MLNKPHCLQQLCLSIRVYWWLTLNIYFRCFYVYVFASVYTCVSKSWHLLGWHVYLFVSTFEMLCYFCAFCIRFSGGVPGWKCWSMYTYNISVVNLGWPTVTAGICFKVYVLFSWVSYCDCLTCGWIKGKCSHQSCPKRE